MALHDVSKDSATRDSPAPNSKDVLLSGSVQAHGTPSVNYTTDALAPISDAHNGRFYIVKTSTFTYTAQVNSVDPGVGNFGTTEILLATIPHGLPYVPTVIAYFTTTTQWQRLPYNDYVAFFTTILWYSLTVTVDATNVRFYFRSMSYNGSSGFGAGFFRFRYYLLRQTST